MTNTHFVDDDVSAETAPLPDGADGTWPLEALATAPVRPLDVFAPRPHQRRYRSVYPHEERVAPPALPRIDVRDEAAWG